MGTELDLKEKVFADYRGYIVASSDKGIGIARGPGLQAEMWLPKSQLGRITYCDGGDARDFKQAMQFEAIEMPRWLAREKQLVGPND